MLFQSRDPSNGRFLERGDDSCWCCALSRRDGGRSPRMNSKNSHFYALLLGASLLFAGSLHGGDGCRMTMPCSDVAGFWRGGVGYCRGWSGSGNLWFSGAALYIAPWSPNQRFSNVSPLYTGEQPVIRVPEPVEILSEPLIIPGDVRFRWKH